MRATLIALGGQDLPAGAMLARIDPGARHMPLHRHWGEEELFHVVEGGGLVVLGDVAHEVGEGDTICRLAGDEAHAFVAGRDGMALLCYGENADLPVVSLPRAGVVRRGPLWWALGRSSTPLEREVAAGPLRIPPVEPRPSCIVHWRDVWADPEHRDGYRGEDRNLGKAAGSVRTGLRRGVLEPGQTSCPPHWHGQETEIFVVLDGEGDLLLHDVHGALAARQPLVSGSVVVRPPGTGVAHALQAGPEGMTYLAYGTRHPGEIVHYPRSSKAYLGKVLVRVQPVEDYWDGELEPPPGRGGDADQNST